MSGMHIFSFTQTTAPLLSLLPYLLYALTPACIQAAFLFTCHTSGMHIFSFTQTTAPLLTLLPYLLYALTPAHIQAAVYFTPLHLLVFRSLLFSQLICPCMYIFVFLFKYRPASKGNMSSIGDIRNAGTSRMTALPGMSVMCRCVRMTETLANRVQRTKISYSLKPYMGNLAF